MMIALTINEETSKADTRTLNVVAPLYAWQVMEQIARHTGVDLGNVVSSFASAGFADFVSENSIQVPVNPN